MATALPVATAFTDASTTEAQLKTALTNLRAALAEMGDPLGRYGVVQNLSITTSQAGNALTIAIKDRAGADPSANSPVSFPFRNATLLTGDFSVLNLTTAHSLVISSGSTLGGASGVAMRLWLVMFNDGGTLRLGVINCRGNGTDIFSLGQFPIASSTAEGAGGTADNTHVFYTGVAVTSKAYVVLGYLEWQTGLGTAGTWNADPTIRQLYGPSTPLPGTVIQTSSTLTGALATGTTQIPNDNTIPQNTEGDQYMTTTITPRSAANVLRTQAKIANHSSTSATVGTAALFQDSGADALAAVAILVGTTVSAALSIEHEKIANLVSATTFKLRAGPDSSVTYSFNASSGNARYGGVLNSYLRVQEVQA